MKLGDLRPNPSNPRKISDPKLKMLKKSLETLGDLSGLIFNRRSGQMVSGHQRLKVLPPDAEIVLESGGNPPSKTGTVSEGYVMIDGEKFKYREVDWDEMTEKTANIAANQHGGEFDFQALTEWVIDLKNENIDLDLIGFDQGELDNILAPLSFEPGSITDQGKLDQKKPVICPNCKHEFTT